MLHQSLAAKALAHPPLELSVRRRKSRLFFHSAQVYQPHTDLIRPGRMGRVGRSVPSSCPVPNLRSLCSYCLIYLKSDNNLVDFGLWRFAAFSPLLFSVWRLPSQVAEAAALPFPRRRSLRLPAPQPLRSRLPPPLRRASRSNCSPFSSP